MKDLETNKIAAAILIAGLIALVTGKVADALYNPELNPEQRGYKVEVADIQKTNNSTAEKEEIIDVKSLMLAADVEKGKASFKKQCSTCHNIEPGDPHKVGPNLANVVGAARPHYSDFNYSKAMKEHKGTWTYADLFTFLHKPRKFVKGTKMSFAGIKKNDDIANVVAYLKSKTNNPPQVK